MKYSIILPSYNEEKYIGKTLTALAVYLDENKIIKDTQIVVVAAKGTDNTADVARSYADKFNNFIVHELPGRVGKGRDVREGFRLATGDYQLFMDADMATPLKYVVPALKMLEDGGDVVIGLRDLSKMHKTFIRKLSSKMSNYIIHKLAVKNVPDTQCGFKGFTSHAADVVFSRTKIQGWGTDIEMLAIARMHGLDIDGIKIPDWEDPKGDDGLAGDSQLSAMKQTLRELFVIRRNIRKGVYL